MRLSLTLLTILISIPVAAFAQHHHGAETYRSLTLQAEGGWASEGPTAGWDLDGWRGGDYEKGVVRSEGEIVDGDVEQAELWGLYSRYLSEFWDVQGGVRFDFVPSHTGYAVFGISGTAPYYFETEAHTFLSDRGDLTARIREEYELLLTQRAVLQPFAEINLSAQRVEETDLGSGITNGEIGTELRYEITRKFAPYLSVKYEQRFGDTADLAAERNGFEKSDLLTTFGVRIIF